MYRPNNSKEPGRLGMIILLIFNTDPEKAQPEKILVLLGYEAKIFLILTRCSITWAIGAWESSKQLHNGCYYGQPNLDISVYYYSIVMINVLF